MDNTPKETTPSPYAPPPLPSHQEFKEKDKVTPLLAQEDAKRAVAQAERDARMLHGFIEVHTCPRCRTRLKPRTVNGSPDYGKCPKCESAVYPDTTKKYIGTSNERTNPHVKPDDNAFASGRTMTGTSIVRRTRPNLGAVGERKTTFAEQARGEL